MSWYNGPPLSDTGGGLAEADDGCGCDPLVCSASTVLPGWSLPIEDAIAQVPSRARGALILDDGEELDVTVEISLVFEDGWWAEGWVAEACLCEYRLPVQAQVDVYAGDVLTASWTDTEAILLGNDGGSIVGEGAILNAPDERSTLSVRMYRFLDETRGGWQGELTYAERRRSNADQALGEFLVYDEEAADTQ